MGKKRAIEANWHRVASVDFDLPLKRFKRHLENKGFREATIESYVGHVGRYLKYAHTDRPSTEMAARFRDTLLDRKLARSTVNNYSFALQQYHNMYGEALTLPCLKRNDQLPYYFSQDDVLRIFSACHNLKHLAMLEMLFYGCLRSSELANLDDRDVDVSARTIHVREGKGGRDGICYMTPECGKVLRQYLEVRPTFEINGRQPLFYTDFGKRWTRQGINRLFMIYKKKAGIEKAGAVHVFARHTSATILVANGCDLRHVKELLRHRDIRTTLRYAHVNEKTLREKYEKCLNLGI